MGNRDKKRRGGLSESIRQIWTGMKASSRGHQKTSETRKIKLAMLKLDLRQARKEQAEAEKQLAKAKKEGRRLDSTLKTLRSGSVKAWDLIWLDAKVEKIVQGDTTWNVTLAAGDNSFVDFWDGNGNQHRVTYQAGDGYRPKLIGERMVLPFTAPDARHALILAEWLDKTISVEFAWKQGKMDKVELKDDDGNCFSTSREAGGTNT